MTTDGQLPRVAIVQNQMAVDGRSRYVGQTILALNALGIEPDLLTLTSPNDVRRWADIQFGENAPRFRLAPGPRLRFRRGYIYQTIAHNWLVRRKLRSYDLIINSNDFLGFLPEKARRIHIIHFPLRANFLVTPRHQRPMWRVLGWPARTAANACDGAPLPTDIVVANSQYTAGFTRKTWPTAPVRVLYPPVAIGAAQAGARDIDVISLGSFSPDKRQLEQVELAAQLPSLRFVIVGSSASSGYARRVRQRAHELKATNVSFLENATDEAVTALLHRARVMIHLKEGEHFGISVAQAMACGCIPIVSDSGGLTEVVPNAELRYASLAEVPGKIQRAVEGALVSATEMAALREHATTYGDAQFHREMQSLLVPVLEQCGHRPGK